MKSFIILVLLLAVAGLLAFTNPDVDQYRGYVKQREGLAGTLSLGLVDLLSKHGDKGIHRDNYFVFSKFYIGGDGILPRQDLAWGVCGKFVDVQVEKR